MFPAPSRRLEMWCSLWSRSGGTAWPSHLHHLEPLSASREIWPVCKEINIAVFTNGWMRQAYALKSNCVFFYQPIMLTYSKMITLVEIRFRTVRHGPRKLPIRSILLILWLNKGLLIFQQPAWTHAQICMSLFTMDTSPKSHFRFSVVSKVLKVNYC